MPEITTPIPLLALTALLGYLLGSVPFGMVWAKLFGLGDIREIGSGNIGATNVLRTGNRLAALLTLIGDIGKGAFAVLVARAALGEDAAQAAGLFAYLGHLFPVYIGFRGGKGVATWLGTILAVAWPVGLVAAGTWLVTAALFRISSLAGLVAAALAPVLALAVGRGEVFVLALLLAALIFERHRANIGRLLRGEEPRIGKT
ncbi:glycerol-3-phosphate 1-O-acyltransferase PlsY [Sinisalibacter aestuarii]|uniref:Glycerol-3-phosphate acyltransferase n=1 Tax=Sinisalibacter aestuarii TaxID=2949426 RepID=A0ABQ5LQG1_9RHOB|nr:glycerol-3-phosphate 1-O-acyltransferase PlsY [Sinisalibacter aestuarii]GKY86302.1 glycerol-3-phosphate acyltransferase [Sinisalibacter aestuarii]